MKLWWKAEHASFEGNLEPFLDNNDAMELTTYAIQNKCEMAIYVEHPGVNEEVAGYCNEEAVETVEDEVDCNVDEGDHVGRSEPNSEPGMNHGQPSVNVGESKYAENICQLTSAGVIF
ncbi:hypothetical protein JHK87_041957 [Glycine soja]|nr:hypothetical protein JHK87_041957 [Glycine soja]